MVNPRIRIETFQVVERPEDHELIVSRGLRVVKELSGDLGYIDPAMEPDGKRLGPVSRSHRKLIMDWSGTRRTRVNHVDINTFDINPGALERPDQTRRYKMARGKPDSVGQAALVAIVNYGTEFLEAQKKANRNNRRIDFYKAGRRATDPIVDLLFLKEDESVFVVVGNQAPFALKALAYRPKDSAVGLVTEHFGPIYEGPTGDDLSSPPEDNPRGRRGGGSDRKPSRPIAPVLSGGASVIPEVQIFTDARATQ